MESKRGKLKMLGYKETKKKNYSIFQKEKKVYLISKDGEETIVETKRVKIDNDFVEITEFIGEEPIIRVGNLKSDLSINYGGLTYFAEDGAYFIVDDNKIRPLLFIHEFRENELYISVVSRTEDTLKLKLYFGNTDSYEVKEKYLNIPKSSKIWDLKQMMYNLGNLSDIDTSDIAENEEYDEDDDEYDEDDDEYDEDDEDEDNELEDVPIVILNEHIIDMNSGNVIKVSKEKKMKIETGFYIDINNGNVYYVEDDKVAFNFKDGQYYEIAKRSKSSCRLKINKENILPRVNVYWELKENIITLK